MEEEEIKKVGSGIGHVRNGSQGIGEVGFAFIVAVDNVFAAIVHVAIFFFDLR